MESLPQAATVFLMRDGPRLRVHGALGMGILSTQRRGVVDDQLL